MRPDPKNELYHCVSLPSRPPSGLRAMLACIHMPPLFQRSRYSPSRTSPLSVVYIGAMVKSRESVREKYTGRRMKVPSVLDDPMSGASTPDSRFTVGSAWLKYGV